MSESMIEAKNCIIGDVYKDIASDVTFIVAEISGEKVFKFIEEENSYTTALNPKYHVKVRKSQ